MFVIKSRRAETLLKSSKANFNVNSFDELHRQYKIPSKWTLIIMI